jgi:hypothetical protein
MITLLDIDLDPLIAFKSPIILFVIFLIPFVTLEVIRNPGLQGIK